MDVNQLFFFLMDFESPTNVGRPCHASGVFFQMAIGNFFK